MLIYLMIINHTQWHMWLPSNLVWQLHKIQMFAHNFVWLKSCIGCIDHNIFFKTMYVITSKVFPQEIFVT